MKHLRDQKDRWRGIAGAFLAGTILLMSLVPVLPHHRDSLAADLTAKAEAHDHGVTHHRADAETEPSHEHPVYPHCPLCTLAKAFALPEPTILPVPFRREKAADPFRLVAAPLWPAADREPQQPRAPPPPRLTTHLQQTSLADAGPPACGSAPAIAAVSGHAATAEPQWLMAREGASYALRTRDMSLPGRWRIEVAALISAFERIQFPAEVVVAP